MTTINAITMLEAASMIEWCWKNDEPLLLLGDPGIGKTALFESTAVRLSAGFIDFRLTMRDPVDVGGMRIPDEKTGQLKHYAPEDLPVSEKRHGKNGGIILFDEINVVGNLMQACAYGIINERRSGTLKLLKGWVPMASGNPVSSGAAGQRINTATASRFNVQYVKPDVLSWLEQFGYANVHPWGVAFLKHRPELFSVMPSNKDQTSFPCARTWTKAFKAFDEPAAIRFKMISGWVGSDAALELEAFLRIMQSAIQFDQILANPKTAPIPTESNAGLYYAVAGMVARLVERKNMDRVMQYVDRMLPDYQVMIVKSCTRRDPSLKTTAGYGAWAVKHQEVLI